MLYQFSVIPLIIAAAFAADPLSPERSAPAAAGVPATSPAAAGIPASAPEAKASAAAAPEGDDSGADDMPDTETDAGEYLTGEFPDDTQSDNSTANSTDQCGPKIPDPTVFDSCLLPVDPVDAPHAWGVQCLNDTIISAPINVNACIPLINGMCAAQWQRPGEWVWNSAPGCSIGSFMTDIPGHAPWPDQYQCAWQIYAAMLQNCLLAGISHAVAAVNVRVLPNNKVGGKGEAVNVGYGSYVIAGEQPRFLSDATCNVTYPGQAPIEVPCDRGGVPAPPLIL